MRPHCPLEALIYMSLMRSTRYKENLEDLMYKYATSQWDTVSEIEVFIGNFVGKDQSPSRYKRDQSMRMQEGRVYHIHRGYIETDAFDRFLQAGGLGNIPNRW